MRKLKIFIIALVCFAALVLIWNVVKHKKEVALVNSTVFQNYTSNGLAFSIEYPKGWTVFEGNPGLDPKQYWAVVFNSPEWMAAPEEDKQFPNLAVNYYANVDTLLGFEERTLPADKKNLENFIESSELMTNIKRTTLAGATAWRATVHGDDEIDTTFVEHAGHIYAIGVSNNIGLSDPMEERIISSFKFTN